MGPGALAWDADASEARDRDGPVWDEDALAWDEDDQASDGDV